MPHLKDIAEFMEQTCRVELDARRGSETVVGPAPLSAAGPGTVTFMKAATPTGLMALASVRASAVFVPIGLAPEYVPRVPLVVFADNPRLEFARMLAALFQVTPVAATSPHALVSADALIGVDVNIGPMAVVGAATIGEGSVVGAGAVIHDGVSVGSNCHIHPGAVIGGAGFGFERDETGIPVRMPHLGSVIVGDDCEVGSQTCIDRGTIADTVLGTSVKIDNLVHIAHNVQLGDGTMIAANAVIAGSASIGKRVWIGPGAVVSDGIVVGDDSAVSLGAVVTKDVAPGERVSGNFAVSHTAFLQHVRAMSSGTQ